MNQYLKVEIFEGEDGACVAQYKNIYMCPEKISSFETHPIEDWTSVTMDSGNTYEVNMSLEDFKDFLICKCGGVY